MTYLITEKVQDWKGGPNAKMLTKLISDGVEAHKFTVSTKMARCVDEFGDCEPDRCNCL